MSVRSKPYTLQAPLDIEALDEMLDILFQDTRNGNLEIDVDQITTGVLPVTIGGTGLSAVVQGDLLYGSAVDTLARLAKDANVTRYLSNTGASNNPAWAQVALSTGVSGDLPFANLTQGSALSVLGVTGNATADHASIAAGTDHQVLRRSGTALAFGAVALGQGAAVSGTLPLANRSNAGTTTSTGTQNNFSFSNTDVLVCNNASLLTFTGLVAGTDGQRLTVVSIGAGAVEFANQSGSSDAANRIVTGSAITVTLYAGIGRVNLVYLAATARWHVIAHEQGYPLSYSTTWEGSVTNPSLGNGTLTSTFVVKQRVVTVIINLTWGSTTTGGSGFWTFTLPFTGDGVGFALPGVANEDGVGAVVIEAVANSTTKMAIVSAPAGALVTATSPFTWGTNDSLVLQGTYTI